MNADEPKIDKLFRLADPARNDNVHERIAANRKILDIIVTSWADIPPQPVQPEQDTYKPTWRDNIEDWWMGIGDFKYTVIGILFWVGIFAGLAWLGSLQPVESNADPIDVIERHIDNIDLSQPADQIRSELNSIKKAIENLREPEADPGDHYNYADA
jgi:hypothetical protein